jgi:XapX domain-containing protein
MRMYMAALVTGVFVGAIYGLLGVRSPAPPVVALVGLLGILVGEQMPPLATQLIARQPVDLGWMKAVCVPHIFGRLPTKTEGDASVGRRARL